MITEIWFPRPRQRAVLTEFAQRQGDFAVVAAAVSRRRPRRRLPVRPRGPRRGRPAARRGGRQRPWPGSRPRARTWQAMGEHAAGQVDPPADTHGERPSTAAALTATLVARALAEASRLPAQARPEPGRHEPGGRRPTTAAGSAPRCRGRKTAGCCSAGAGSWPTWPGRACCTPRSSAARYAARPRRRASTTPPRRHPAACTASSPPPASVTRTCSRCWSGTSSCPPRCRSWPATRCASSASRWRWWSRTTPTWPRTRPSSWRWTGTRSRPWPASRTPGPRKPRDCTRKPAGNRLVDLLMFDDDRLPGIFAAAAVTVSATFPSARVAALPLEGRACLAEWDDRDDQLVMHVSTQVPHQVRSGIAQALGLPGARHQGDRPGRRRRIRPQVRGRPGRGGGRGGRAAAAAAGALGRGPAGEPDRRVPRPRAAIPGQGRVRRQEARSSAWTRRSTATSGRTPRSRSPARSSR